MKKCILSIIVLLVSGCTNPYSKFYQDCTGGKNWDESRIITSTDEPKLRQGFDPEDDAKHMLEDGYCLIGQSYFNAVEVSQDAAVEQAKKVHADTIFIYSKYTHTLSGYMPLTMPNMQTGTTFHSGTIYGSGGGSANYFGSSSTTTYGTSTTYIPYNVASAVSKNKVSLLSFPRKRESIENKRLM
jgi:hypothetical protein